jgi:hypothetical protein
MNARTWIMGTAGPLILGMALTTGHAAPMPRASSEVASAAGKFSLVEKTAGRYCWRHNGRRHCTWQSGRRVYGNRDSSSSYYEHDPDKLAFGSQRWWEEMLRQNRAGNSGGGGRN